jgi:5-methylcytosine-specific restriction endonuclease McrA
MDAMPKLGPQWAWLRAQAAARLPARCQICGRMIRPGDPFELDHIQPRALGGALYDPANLRPLHRSCNRRRPRATKAERQAAARRRAARDWEVSSPRTGPEPAETPPPSWIW